MRSASATRSVRMWLANCQPTIRRLNASITKLKNTTPSQQQVREVRQPQRVGPVRGEVAVDEVGAARRGWV
jgi:hypothetical protein